jgi:alanyl-tRNA synthetase
MLDEHSALKRQVEEAQHERAVALADELAKKAIVTDSGARVITARLPMPADAVKDIVFRLRNQNPENTLVVVGSVHEGKPMLTVSASDDLVQQHSIHAGQLVREAAKLIQGGGGGQPHYATAGGKNPDALPVAIDKVIELAAL